MGVLALCEQNTLTRHIFSCLSALMIMSHTTLAQGVSARHTIHVSCACVFDLSSTLSSHSSFISPIFYFILLILKIGSEQNTLCASANEEPGPWANCASLAGWSAGARPPHGRKKKVYVYIMFGPVVTTEVLLAYAGTAFLSTVVTESSTHAAVYHAARLQSCGEPWKRMCGSLGTFGLVSNQNISTRWAHPSFDSNSCFATCHNLGALVKSCKSYVMSEHRGYLPPYAKPEVSVSSSAVFLRGLSCLCHCPPGRLSFIHLTQSFRVPPFTG